MASAAAAGTKIQFSDLALGDGNGTIMTRRDPNNQEKLEGK